MSEADRIRSQLSTAAEREEGLWSKHHERQWPSHSRAGGDGWWGIGWRVCVDILKEWRC